MFVFIDSCVCMCNVTAWSRCLNSVFWKERKAETVYRHKWSTVSYSLSAGWKIHRPKTDVPALCHASNQVMCCETPAELLTMLYNVWCQICKEAWLSSPWKCHITKNWCCWDNDQRTVATVFGCCWQRYVTLPLSIFVRKLLKVHIGQCSSIVSPE